MLTLPFRYGEALFLAERVSVPFQCHHKFATPQRASVALSMDAETVQRRRKTEKLSVYAVISEGGPPNKLRRKNSLGRPSTKGHKRVMGRQRCENGSSWQIIIADFTRGRHVGTHGAAAPLNGAMAELGALVCLAASRGSTSIYPHQVSASGFGNSSASSARKSCNTEASKADR